MKKLDIKNGWLVNLGIIAVVILLAFLLSSLSGCMTPSKINKFKQQYCKDSVSIQIKERVVKVPIYYSDSSMLEIWLQCDSLGNIYYTNWKQIEGKYSDLQAALKDNVLTVKNYVTIYDTAHISVTDTVKFQQANVTTNVLTKTQSFWVRTGKWSFSIVIILLVIAVVYMFFKFKNKLLAFFTKS